MVEPHNQKVFKNNRVYEIGHGSHVLGWSLALVAGLVAGTQVTCIFLLPSMFVWACFHYSAGGKTHAVLYFTLTVALAYFGLVPYPTVPSLEWTPAAIWMTFLAPMCVLAALPQLMGGKVSQCQYDARPYLKKRFCDDSEALLSDAGSGEEEKHYRRARELAWGAHLLGMGCCMAAAVIAGGAQDLCLLSALPMVTNGYCHWLQREDHADEKNGAPFCWIVAMVTLGLGIAR